MTKNENHDALCPSRHKEWILGTYCTYCQLIRATREDERSIMEKFFSSNIWQSQKEKQDNAISHQESNPA